MNTRSIVYWFLAASSLLAAIYFLHQRGPTTAAGGLAPILPQLRPLKISAIQVRPPGTNQLEIRAELKDGGWQLVSPIAYPAQSASIQKLLAYLQKLTPATVISPTELKGHARADEEYGFVSPQVSTIIIEQDDLRFHLQVGRKTNPGDQVFLQVIGSEGAYVVDAELLNYIPRSVSLWRNTALVDLNAIVFNRISLTNNSKPLEMQRDAASRLWRITWPTQARANTSKIQDALTTLQATSIREFITDDPKADLESLGLVPPRMELAFSQGANLMAALHFGRERTNGTAVEVFARRPGQSTVFTLPADSIDFWRRASVNDLRDPHILALSALPNKVEVFAEQDFALQLRTNGQWNILPEDLPADPVLVKDFVDALLGLEIVQFVKDVVAQPDLSFYGLSTPTRRFVLHVPPGQTDPAPATNDFSVELQFGTNSEDRVFARRTDENSVYAVAAKELRRFPSFPWQIRNRRPWNITEEDVASVTLRQKGRVRQIMRKGPHDWSLAPGSQGVINDIAVEETVKGLAKMVVPAWVDCGKDRLPLYGFTNVNDQITMELKDGGKATVEFGGEAQSTFPYATILLQGKPYIFEFPWVLYRDVVSYLSVPPNP